MVSNLMRARRVLLNAHMVQWIEHDPSKVVISVQFGVWVPLYADVAQLVSAIGSYPIGFGGSSPLIGTSTSFSRVL